MTRKKPTTVGPEPAGGIYPPFESDPTDKAYVFVSYSHADSKKVYPIIDRLHKHGIPLWYDEGIDPSIHWRNEIAEKIMNCTAFLSFISPNIVSKVKNEPTFPEKEINLAINQHKRIITVFLEPTTLSPGLLLEVPTWQCLMKYEMREEDFWRKLVNAFKREIQGASPEGIGEDGKNKPLTPASGMLKKGKHDLGEGNIDASRHRNHDGTHHVILNAFDGFIAALVKVQEILSRCDHLDVRDEDKEEFVKMQEQAANAYAVIAGQLAQYPNRMKVFGQEREAVDVFIESLGLDDRCGSSILPYAIQGARITRMKYISDHNILSSNLSQEDIKTAFDGFIAALVKMQEILSRCDHLDVRDEDKEEFVKMQEQAANAYAVIAGQLAQYPNRM
nr:toll/interleukin-1 receptor domain-containing protein [Candidatus Sigynarchaeota archaeon]